MVPGAGLEPALLSEEDFKSSVSAIPPSGQHHYKITVIRTFFKGRKCIYPGINQKWTKKIRQLSV